MLNAVIVMSAFGAIWCAVGIGGLSRGSPALYAIPPAIAGAIIALAARRRSRSARPLAAERPRVGRVVGIASGVEGVAILLAVRILVSTGHPSFIAPVVAIIVGLHFVPLARGLRAPLYYVACVLLVAVGAAGFGIADANRRLLFVCFGAAAVLWGIALAVAGRGDRRP